MIQTTNAPLAPAQSDKETKHMKNYALMNKKTGKITGRKFATREAARTAKREGGFKHSIYKFDTGTIVR